MVTVDRQCLARPEELRYQRFSIAVSRSGILPVEYRAEGGCLTDRPRFPTNGRAVDALALGRLAADKSQDGNRLGKSSSSVPAPIARRLRRRDTDSTGVLIGLGLLTAEPVIGFGFSSSNLDLFSSLLPDGVTEYESPKQAVTTVLTYVQQVE